jgi:Domain of unknown function (DUF4252)
MRITTMLTMALVAPLWAQEINLPPNLEQLSAKAEESVVVTLDKSMLEFASRFMDKDSDAHERKIIAGLDKIYVRSFEFSNDGEYNMADVDALRAQFQSPPWGRIVGVRSSHNGDNVDVYFKDGGNSRLGGIVIISAEPRELTIVHLSGTIDPDDLSKIGGNFDIPRLDVRAWRREQ